MKLIDRARDVFRHTQQAKNDSFETRLLVGTLLAKTVGSAASMREAEFKVFSQFGDNGIIQFLIKKLNIKIEKFVEFGVENYEESNTRFLLLNDNWSGLVIHGSDVQVASIKKNPSFWRYDLTALCAFITAKNIINFWKVMDLVVRLVF